MKLQAKTRLITAHLAQGTVRLIEILGLEVSMFDIKPKVLVNQDLTPAQVTKLKTVLSYYTKKGEGRIVNNHLVTLKNRQLTIEQPDFIP